MCKDMYFLPIIDICLSFLYIYLCAFESLQLDKKVGRQVFHIFDYPVNSAHGKIISDPDLWMSALGTYLFHIVLNDLDL